MAGSYEQINYALRPAKAVERKMLAEAFSCLRSFRNPSTYRYIGFGSTYFSDFHLLHKTLGVTDMHSIEKDRHNQTRFEFNRPFHCIKLVFDDSITALPALVESDIPSIVWLDYDGTISADVLADTRTVISNLSSGSVFLYSLNVNPEPLNNCESRKDDFSEKVGEGKVPTRLKEKDFAKWGTAQASREVVDNVIHEALTARNAPRPPTSQFVYQQLFNFHYQDGAKMLTCGGIVLDEGAMSSFSSSGLSQLGYFRDGKDAYEIKVPNLTYREIHYLNKALPDGVIKDRYCIPERDIASYKEVYRYFPAFSEVFV
jgi:hypothetical protein